MSDTYLNLTNTILPSTSSVEAALDFIHKHLDAPSLNHVIRSALFACIIAQNLSGTVETHLQPVDIEIVAVATLLHDMAWNPLLASTRQFISKDKRFEVDSANVARGFLKGLQNEHGWDQRRLQLVWDSIALHTTPSISWHKEPEVVLCGYGILLDIVGVPEMPLPGVPQGSSVSREKFEEIYTHFPSLQLAGYVKDALCALCQEKPETTLDNFVGDFGERYVEGFTLVGKRMVDRLKIREQAEDDGQGK